MPKKFLTSYFVIVIVLIILMNLSKQTSDHIRGQTTFFLAPLLAKLQEAKSFFSSTSSKQFTKLQEEIEQLQASNQLLLQKLQEAQIELGEKNSLFPDSFVETSLQTLPAKVIFRSFDKWNQEIWIDKGQVDNLTFNSPLIAKNSPVVVGRNVIGLIDYVGEKQSRVRLITDNQLVFAVQATRGKQHDFLLQTYAKKLLAQLRFIPLNLANQEKLSFVNSLQKLALSSSATAYLAKGELRGGYSITQQGLKPVLKGKGFSFDCSENCSKISDATLQINDVLITTGLDGIFPAGLQVATVSKIDPLQEGDYFYTLEAEPIISLLDGLSLVCILPPLAELNLIP